MIDIGELRGLISIKDEFSGPLSDFASKIGLSSGSLGTFAAAAGVAVGVVATLTGTIIALGQRGADVDDIASSFDDLSKNVGSTGREMLGALQRGTLNTISNFELMTAANKPLSAGIIRTAEDMETLAAGAKIVADRTGKDAVSALNEMTSAMASGRTMALSQMGIMIDSKKVIEDYALSQGRAKDSLSQFEERTAVAQAVLARLREELERTGGPVADFNDKIDQARTGVRNFIDDLSRGIALSPVVSAGMDAIGEAMGDAFGDNQEERIQTIIGYVNKFAIGLSYGADVAVTTAQVIHSTWNALKLIFAGAMTALMVPLELAAKASANFVESMSKLPVIGDSYKASAAGMRDMANQMEGMRKSFQEQTLEAHNAGKSIDESYGKVRSVISKVREEMIEASATQVAANTITAQTETVTRGANTAVHELTEGQREAAKASMKAAEESKKFYEELGKTADQVQVGLQALSDEEFADKFGGTLKKLEVDLKLLGVTGEAVPEAIREGFERLFDIESAEWFREQATGFEEFKRVGTEAADAVFAQEMKVLEAWKVSNDIRIDAEKKRATTQREVAMQTAEFEIGMLKAKGARAEEITRRELELSAFRRDAEIADLDARFRKETEGMDRNSAGYRAMVAAHREAVDQIALKWEQGQRLQREETESTKGEFLAGLDSMADSFEQLAIIGGDKISDITRGIGGLIKSIDMGVESIGHMRKGFADVFSGGGLSNILGGIGSIATGVGGIVSIASSAISLLGGLFEKGGALNNLFGGPSKEELAGRETRAGFTSEISSNLTDAQKRQIAEIVASGQDESWARQAVAMQGLYVAAGRSAEEALTDLDRLFRAEKEGPGAVEKLIAEIRLKTNKFHTGGVVPGSGEQLATVLGGERILSPRESAVYDEMAVNNSMLSNQALLEAVTGLRSDLTSMARQQDRSLRRMLDEQALILPRAIAAAQALA